MSFETLLDMAYSAMGPWVGMLALVGVGIGLLAGITKKVGERFGQPYILLAIAIVVVLVWGFKYLQAPKIEVVEREVEVEVERRVEVPVERIVEKVVKDTRESDALRQQIEAKERVIQAKEEEKRGLMDRLFGYEKKESEQERVENTKRAAEQSVVNRRNWLFEKAANAPYYEVAQKENDSFIISRYKAFDDALIRTDYTGRFELRGVTDFASFKRCEVSGQDSEGRRFGKPSFEYVIFNLHNIPQKDGKIDSELLSADLNEGEVSIHHSAHDIELRYYRNTKEKIKGRK